MKHYVLAALLSGALAAPAHAATFYVVKNRETKQCSVATTPPTNTKMYRKMAGGPYGSEREAQKALEANKKCK